METKTELNYPFQAAGRVWQVPELALTRLPDGTLAISQEEILRVHRAIANELCGGSRDLTGVELEFFCDVTDHLFAEVASYLGVHKSTVTKWRRGGRLPHLASLALKKWFWFGLFGDALHEWNVPLGRLEDDAEFLALARAQAIARELVEPVAAKVA